MDIISYLIGVSVGFMLAQSYQQLKLGQIKLSKESYISIGVVLFGIVFLVVGIITE